jgi:hypothetical protein
LSLDVNRQSQRTVRSLELGLRSKKYDSDDDLSEEFPEVIEPGEESQPHSDP